MSSINRFTGVTHTRKCFTQGMQKFIFAPLFYRKHFELFLKTEKLGFLGSFLRGFFLLRDFVSPHRWILFMVLVSCDNVPLSADIWSYKLINFSFRTSKWGPIRLKLKQQKHCKAPVGIFWFCGFYFENLPLKRIFSKCCYFFLRKNAYQCQVLQSRKKNFNLFH